MLKQIMTRAHEIARTLEGDYMARMSEALRLAWVEAKLVRIGSLWQKPGMARIYFNDLSRWYGLETDHYKTGNIAAAKLDGECISNSKARKIEGRLSFAKVWYDLATGKFFGKDITSDDLHDIVTSIKAEAKVA